MPQITVNNARHHFRLEGDRGRPCLALIHPIGADHGIWDKAVPLLAQQFCVLRHDLRGHGASEVGDGEYTLDQLARDLLELTAALGFPNLVACGISLGGLVALQAALQAPGRVRAAVVCSAAARMAPPPGGWEGRARQALEQGMESMADGMVQRMFGATFRASGDAGVATCRNTFALMDARGYANACAVLRDADLTGDLPGIGQPVMVVSGRDDALMPVEAARFMAQALPLGRQLELPAGHFPPLEMPREFAAGVQDFIASVAY